MNTCEPPQCRYNFNNTSKLKCIISSKIRQCAMDLYLVRAHALPARSDGCLCRCV